MAQPLAKRVLPPALTLPKAEVSWHWQERLKTSLRVDWSNWNGVEYLWLVLFKNSTAACWVRIETTKSDAFWTSPECDFASWAVKYRKLFLSWVLVSNMKVFSPRKLGKMNPFWRSFFSKGWFNHRRSLAYIIFPCIFWAEASFLDDRLGVWKYQFGEPATFSRNSYHLMFFKSYLCSFNHLQMNWYMKYLDHLQKAHALAHARRIEFDPFDRKSLDQTVPWIGSRCRPRQRDLVGFRGRDRLLGALCWVQKLGSWVFGSWMFFFVLSKEIYK